MRAQSKTAYAEAGIGQDDPAIWMNKNACLAVELRGDTDGTAQPLRRSKRGKK
jgi:hypothetical protein